MVSPSTTTRRTSGAWGPTSRSALEARRRRPPARQPSGSAGTPVKVAGSNFAYTFKGGTVGAVLSVTFNGIPVPAKDVVVNSDSSITVTVPDGATSGRIAVRSATGTGYSTTDFKGTGLTTTGPAPTVAFLEALYRDVLDRDPDAQGMTSW